jgi:hypothetical protein
MNPIRSLKQGSEAKISFCTEHTPNTTTNGSSSFKYSKHAASHLILGRLYVGRRRLDHPLLREDVSKTNTDILAHYVFTDPFASVLKQ